MRYQPVYAALTRPWKLVTLTIGLTTLISGSFFERQLDWDIGISLIMGILTYLSAPFVIRVLYTMNWRMMPLAALLAWFTIDGAYWLYNAALGHPYVRAANASVSTPLYLAMGLIWSLDFTIGGEMKRIKKVGKAVAIFVVCSFLFMLAELPWIRSLPQEKWEKFKEQDHCKLIAGNDYQCDMGKVHKTYFD